MKKEHNFKVLFQITLRVETFQKHLEKQNLKGKIRCPGDQILTQADPITTSPPLP